MNGITFLLFLVLCGVYVGCSPSLRRYVTCEGQTAHLTCSSGYIKVTYANYGRNDKTTCSTNRPYQQIKNEHCFLQRSLSILETRCNGQQSCSVPATNHVFSDPCYGTYKYLDVSYLCIQYKRRVICEHHEGEISCDHGALFIHHANYGRRDRHTCPHEKATTSDCYFPQTYSVRSMCKGKRYCHLKASNDVYSDPCFGVYKYLEVTYSCSAHE